MSQVYNLISDWDLNDELSYCLRNRDLEQKFLYMDDWAYCYYNVVEKDKIYYWSYSHNNFLDFWLKNIFLKNKNITIISLWCWNSEIESFIFENLKKNFQINYYWVDSSKNMLELSIKRMNKIKNIEKYFICADFSTNEFRRELSQFTSGSSMRIFTFFSNTFWNINPNNIIDILYNLLKTWEKIWLDVRLRSWTTTKDDMKDFEKYYWYLWNKISENHFKFPLEEINIDPKKWFMWLNSVKINPLGAIKYEYSFTLNTKTTIIIRNEKITILPKESLKILNVYTYDPDWLINFFEWHNFKLIDKFINEWRWQFLFEKK